MKLFLVTYNILFGYDLRVFHSLRKIYTLSRKYTHAIVALQEVRNKTFADKLPDKITKIFPKFSSSQLVSPKPSLNDLGLITLASLEKIDEIPVLLPQLPKRLLNPQSYFLKTMPQHGALISRYAMGRKILRVTNVHLDVMGGTRHKRKQMRIILDYLALQRANYDVICGDFNTIGPIKIMRRRMLKQKNAIHQLLGKSYEEVSVPTWTSDVTQTMSPLIPARRFINKAFKLAHISFRQKLDWIFVRGFKKTTADARHDLAGSDHYPIFAVLNT